MHTGTGTDVAAAEAVPRIRVYVTVQFACTLRQDEAKEGRARASERMYVSTANACHHNRYTTISI